jgi:hypothetical protein
MLWVRPVLEQRFQGSPIRFEVLQLGANERDQPLFRPAHAGQRGLEQRLHVVAGPLVEGHHHRLLGGEVVVGGSRRHPGCRGDVTHGGLVEPLRLEESKRGVQDAGGGDLRFGVGHI